MLLTMTLSASQRIEFNEAGDFFRLLAAGATLDVEFYKNGSKLCEADGVGSGYAERFLNNGFDKFVIQNGSSGQSIQFVTRLGNVVDYDSPSNNKGPATQSAVLVGTSNSTYSANPNRNYLLIQNVSASTIWINVAGNPANSFSGLELGPGASFEMSAFCTTSGLSFVASDANGKIIVLEA